MIKVNGLSGGYTDQNIIKEANFEIATGEFFALIGPNGSGKTTLFKLLTGILPHNHGRVDVFDQPISSYSAQEKARSIAVLSQESHVEFDFTVEEIVMLGRYPHQKGLFKHVTKKDHEIVTNVMKKTHVYHYRNQPYKWLSGGEKQRVLLAKALAQEPKILFLDEPTNHLDIKHTVEMLQQLKEYQITNQLTIVAILHDLNTAALFADKVGVLNNGHLVEIGDISVFNNEQLLEDVYEVSIRQQSHPVLAKPQVIVSPKESALFSLKHSLDQDSKCIHIRFDNPLRTISNAVVGAGIQWTADFCNYHVHKGYNCSDPVSDVNNWLKEASISEYNTIGMMTAVNLEDNVVIQEKFEGINMMSVVTAGVGNAVDITETCELEEEWQIGTVNIMVFIDHHLTDGGLVNAVQSATEAKTKAFFDLGIKDPGTQTLATGTSTDCISIAVTQNGDPTPYAGSGTVVGRGIGSVVYKAVIDAIKKYDVRKKRYENELG